MIIFGVPLQNTDDRMQIGSVVPEILKTGLKHHISDLTKISIFSTIIDFFRKTKNTPRAMIITYHMPKTASKSVHWILSYDRGHTDKHTNKQTDKQTDNKSFFSPESKLFACSISFRFAQITPPIFNIFPEFLYLK